MKRVVVLGGLLVLTAAACTSTPQHDVVVGEIARCQVRVTSTANGGITHAFQDLSGDDCSAQGVLSVYVELTIRTPKGTTYTTKIPTNRKVQIGDPWPE